jgi:hypothetical protein
VAEAHSQRLFELIERILRKPWLFALVSSTLAAAVILLDYATGPHLRFRILFVFPVAFAALRSKALALTMATLLPTLRFAYFRLAWEQQPWVAEEIANSVTTALALALLTWMIRYIMRQRREIEVLRGILPICSFCKHIRNAEGKWTPIESFFSGASRLEFSHGLCPACAEKHYGFVLSEEED